MENFDFREKNLLLKVVKNLKNTAPFKISVSQSTNRDTAHILLAKVKKHSKTWKILTWEKKFVV